MIVRGLAVASALLLAGCDASPADDLDALKQASRDWSAASARGDRAAVLATFADDAILVQEGQPPLRGKAAIARNLQQAAALPGYSVTWEPIDGAVSGDLGWLLERTRVTMTGPAGTPVEQNLQSMTVWRRSADGSWKNVAGTAVSGPPTRN